MIVWLILHMRLEDYFVNMGTFAHSLFAYPEQRGQIYEFRSYGEVQQVVLRADRPIASFLYRGESKDIR